MKAIVILCSFFCAMVAALAQTTPISNLNQSSDSGDGISGSIQEAVSFTTDNTTNFLLSVSVSLSGFFNGDSPGLFNLSLYSDAAGSPGTNLTTLSGNNYPTNAGIYTYTGSHLLLPNTTYWLVASSPESGGSVYGWFATYSTSLDSGSSWTLGASKTYDGGWSIANDGSKNLCMKFSVTVLTNLPSPAISIFQPIVLTYTNFGYSFVLQQNSNLAKTNWVNATNAIQISTVNTNQTVFIVPPNGSQMFYRLSLQ